MRGDHELVFSHGDLNLHNIIVKDGDIVALLDWECAGWCPEHWEYVKFCAASLYDRERHQLGSVIFLTTYPDEVTKDQFYALLVFRDIVLRRAQRAARLSAVRLVNLEGKCTT